MTERTWKVYSDEDLVLLVSSTPGTVRSAARPQAGQTSEFLSASSRAADLEDLFRDALSASHSVDEFLAALTARGLTVTPDPPP